MRKIACLLIAGSLLAGCTAIHPPAYNFPARENIQVGGEVAVERGQNVYAIAAKNGVSMRELIALNDLKPPFIIKPGQTLLLPAGGRGEAPVPSAAPSGGVESAPMEPYVPGGSSSISSGDVTAVPLEAPPVAEKAKPIETTVAPIEESKPVSVLPGAAGTKMAAVTPPKEQVKSFSADEKISFIWPVQGPVTSGFGSKQGVNNDGINIAAPKGSSIVAAAGGIVAYAGNEMKGFGNLVLIRHENGWVTAYAHLDRMMVTRDAVVAAGDMIGTVGQTGGVATPQLHFETRLDGKPVDPQTVIKK